MSITNDDDFDYPAYTRDNPPDPTKIRRGIEARRQRIEAAMKRPAIRIDEDILAQLQRLIAPGQTAEQVINQALREWLSAQDMRELLRTELQQAVQRAFMQVGADLPKVNSP